MDIYLNRWGNQRKFEFVEFPFDDIKIGSFSTWRRIARLAKGLEAIHNGQDNCDYYRYDFSYMPGGEEYTGNIEGYCDPKRYKFRTANPIYNEIIESIAVIDIKKIGGGTTAGSELSIAGGHYSQHIAPFEDLLCLQIELINPTVVICCGRFNGSCISNMLTTVKEATGNRLWIDGYHPVHSTNKRFYEDPLYVYKEYLCK